MSARHTVTRRFSTMLATLLIALAALPVVAAAQPLDPSANRPFMKSATSEPAPTVIRTTVVKQEAARALPIVLAGAALIIAIAGTGVALARIAPVRRQLGVGH